MEYLISGFVVWFLCGAISIVSVSMPLEHGSDRWDFNLGIRLSLLLLLLGIFSQILIKHVDNKNLTEEINNSIEKS